MPEVKAWSQIQGMTFDQKIAVLSIKDKAYVSGFIDRAVFEHQKRLKDMIDDLQDIEMPVFCSEISSEFELVPELQSFGSI